MCGTCLQFFRSVICTLQSIASHLQRALNTSLGGHFSSFLALFILHRLHTVQRHVTGNSGRIWKMRSRNTSKYSVPHNSEPATIACRCRSVK
jgi:hypothetical protein